MFAPDGTLRAALARREDRQSLHLRRPDGSWAQVDERHWRDAGAVQPVHAAADGRLFGLAQHGDKRALFVLDPETGRPAREPMLESPDFDLAPHFISSRDGLLGVRYLVDGEATLWLDESMKALQQRIDQRLPGRVNRVDPPRHGDSPWVLVQSWSDRQPLMALVFHRETGEVLRLGSSHPEIEPRAMGRTELHRIPARDGLPLPAWLTLPADEAKGPRPMVLLVHGGPWVRGAQWRWDPEVQFLASRGYAVLQVEFRGSTGFGARHFEAGIGQWGQAMQTDLADAARWAIARGTADADRIAIMGASYGGYATLMGLVTDPGLYRCGVAWVGVTDPMLLFSVDWSDITGESKRYGLTTLIGDPVADAERLRRASPLRRAAEIKSPLMLAYGAWDLRVPLVHGEKMREALKSHGARHEWVVYDNEGHGWSRAENRVNFWTRVEAFLARELAPR